MDDRLVEDVRAFSGGRSITESMVIALTDWLRIQKIKALNRQLDTEPFEFQSGFSADKIRKLNRRK